MLKKTARFMLVLGVLSFLFQNAARGEVKEFKIDSAESEIKFSVSAAVYTIHGKAAQAESRVSFDSEAGAVHLPLKIEIPVDSLKTKNKLRDKDMRKMFDSKNYPVILWTAEEVVCEPRATEGAFACTAKGVLTLKGTGKKIVFPIDLQLENGRVRASGLLDIKRADYGLKTPSMLGLIRVSQEVTIEFNTVWIPE